MADEPAPEKPQEADTEAVAASSAPDTDQTQKPRKHRFQKGNKIGRQFKPGESGNPRGVSKLVAQWKAAMEGELPPDAVAEATRALREAARQGDVSAIKLLLDRTVGPLADAPKVAVNVLNLLPAGQTRTPVSLDEWKERAREFTDVKVKP